MSNKLAVSAQEIKQAAPEVKKEAKKEPEKKEEKKDEPDDALAGGINLFGDME